MKLLAAIIMTMTALMATSVTGFLRNPDGTGANGKLYLALSQQAALTTASGCGGPIQVLPTYRVTATITSGVIVGGMTVYGNDCLMPQGTYYNVWFYNTSGNLIFTDRWQISGSSTDVGTIVSVNIQGTTATLGSPGVVFTVPTGSQTVTQPIGTTLNVNHMHISADVTMPNGASCTSTGCTGFMSGAYVDLTSSQSITGQKNINGADLLFTNASVGSLAFPATDGFYKDSVWTPIVKIFNGTPASLNDYFSFENTSVHVFNLFNSVGTIVWQLNESASPHSTMSFDAETLVPFTAGGGSLGKVGHEFLNLYLNGAAVINGGISMPTGVNSQIVIGAGGNFYDKAYSGADASCGGVVDGWMGIRTDTSKLQVCIGGTLKQASLL